MFLTAPTLTVTIPDDGEAFFFAAHCPSQGDLGIHKVIQECIYEKKITINMIF